MKKNIISYACLVGLLFGTTFAFAASQSKILIINATYGEGTHVCNATKIVAAECDNQPACQVYVGTQLCNPDDPTAQLVTTYRCTNNGGGDTLKTSTEQVQLIKCSN